MALQQVLPLAAETVRGIPLTGRTLGGTQPTYPTFRKPSEKFRYQREVFLMCKNAAACVSRDEMKTSAAPLTSLHTQAVVQVEAAAAVLTLLVRLAHQAALGTFCTAGGRLIGKGGRGTVSCAGLLDSQEKT